MKTPPTPQALLQAIAQIEQMERGTLSVIREGPSGPYYNHQCYENGKNVSRYVPRDQVAELQAALAGHQQFQQLTEQYAEWLIQQTRAARAAGAKKKPRPRSSSSPRTRKSSK